ncbi:helix-turn-helix domain-containing protein [Pseudoclavibacter sp. CFCC 13611]|uniref:helix-turn-helix domain-containing protein n=1 Tax=Pseudoclavibacter sp. CFCC 13611 TaxID=2615178 RepID=UPI001301019D|nr:helix-turn-helix transcriptional regulator [Pseudoclavibacter sp. CFCC 13611]KAB1662755.1 helix-turn-helix transcriptional regulator [Pseudoclavibacter sp. CFCC 13611]
MEIELKQIGWRIRNYRRLNGWSQQQLADLVPGLSRGTLSQIESQKSSSETARKTLDFSLLLGIAWALRVPPVALVVDVTKPDQTVTVNDRVFNRVSQSWELRPTERSTWDVIVWFMGWSDHVGELSADNTAARGETYQQLGLLQGIARAEQSEYQTKVDNLDYPPAADYEAEGEAAALVDRLKSEARALGIEFGGDTDA